mgnify:CR=1 FL=1
MKKKNVGSIQISQSEAQLIEQFRQHPEMMARVQSILDLAYNEAGPLKTADQVEELLIQELRRLGNTSMHQWATQAEERVSRELKDQDQSVRSRKKNIEVVVCLWVSGGAGSDLAQSEPELSSPLAATVGSHVPRAVTATPTGTDGLWLRAFL